MKQFTPKELAFIKNIYSGNRDTLNKKTYLLIKGGIEIMPILETFSGLKSSTMSARLNDLQSHGLITTLGVKAHKGKTYSRYVTTPKGQEQYFADKFRKETLVKRYESVLKIENDKERIIKLKEIIYSLKVE